MSLVNLNSIIKIINTIDDSLNPYDLDTDTITSIGSFVVPSNSVVLVNGIVSFNGVGSDNTSYQYSISDTDDTLGTQNIFLLTTIPDTVPNYQNPLSSIIENKTNNPITYYITVETTFTTGTVSCYAYINILTI